MGGKIELSDLELTAIYVALYYSIDTCDIFWEQDDDLQDAAEDAFYRVLDLMEQKGLLKVTDDVS